VVAAATQEGLSQHGSARGKNNRERDPHSLGISQRANARQ
jgi:hypothetical protein